MTVPLIFSDDPFLSPTDVTLPTDVPTVAEFAESVSIADLPQIFDAAFSVLAQAGPIGPAYALYSGPPSGLFDLEVGFPVAAVPEKFTAGTFPSGSALALSHIGGFDGLGDAWGRLMQEFTDRELGPIRLIAEIYVSDPTSTPPADLRTDLFVLY